MIKRFLHSSDTLKHSLVLIGGTVLAQLVPILLQPLLRRMYEPSDFGLFALYSTIYGMLVALANFKYESTVVLPKEDEEASNLLASGIFLSFLFSVLLLLLVLFAGDFFMHYFAFPAALKPWLYILPVSVFCLSSYQCMNYWFIRKKAFKTSSINKVVRRGAEGAVQVGAGFSFKSIGLIVGSIVGDVANVLSGIWQLKNRGFSWKVVSWTNMKSAMLTYKDFPLYHAFPSFLNAISLTLPVLLLNKFYGEEITGQFDLSRMILALPLALVSISLSQVLLQRFSESIQQQKSIRSEFAKTFKILLVIAIPATLLALFFSQAIFVFLFGESWRLAGYMTQVLIASYAIKFIVSPLSMTFIALKKVRWSAMWQFAYFVAMVSLFFVGKFELNEFLILYLIIDIIFYTIYFLLSYFLVLQNEKNIKI